MNFGLSDAIVADSRRVPANYPEVRRALLYGSRGRGNFSPESDIDIAIDAAGMDNTTFASLCAALEAVPMVFKLDILRLDTAQNQALVQRAQRDGKPFV